VLALGEHCRPVRSTAHQIRLPAASWVPPQNNAGSWAVAITPFIDRAMAHPDGFGQLGGA